ncbi:MAG: tetratricopeptide repeat protein [Candidatus Omnitrophota bacterium]
MFFQESQNLRSLRAHGYRILCLGESTTAGTYPSFLEEELNRRGQGIPFSVIDKGIPSTNTDVILAQLEANLDKYKPDLVVTMMGINDQGKHMPPEVKSSSRFVRWLFSLRVVKLVRSLGLHLTEKIKKTNEVKPPVVQTPASQEPAVEVPREKLKDFGLRGTQELLGVSGGPYSVDELKCLSDGWKALSDGDLGGSEKAFNKVLAKNPKNAQAYYGLSWVHRNGTHEDQIEGLLLKVIELMPYDVAGYRSLGDQYLSEKKYEQAEAAYKKAELLGNKNKESSGDMGIVTMALVHIYMAQKRYADAEQALKKFLAANPTNDLCHRRLILFYHETGRHEEAAACENKERSLDKDFYNVVTVTNYRRLKAILDSRKIKLVCAQYPMRNISVLKEIFADRDGVFFVDNEKPFKTAVAGGRLHEYFFDMFGGDFGHCTKLGNKLLAEQIADVVLKEVLGMK